MLGKHLKKVRNQRNKFNYIWVWQQFFIPINQINNSLEITFRWFIYYKINLSSDTKCCHQNSITTSKLVFSPLSTRFRRRLEILFDSREIWLNLAHQTSNIPLVRENKLNNKPFINMLSQASREYSYLQVRFKYLYSA